MSEKTLKKYIKLTGKITLLLLAIIVLILLVNIPGLIPVAIISIAIYIVSMIMVPFVSALVLLTTTYIIKYC